MEGPLIQLKSTLNYSKQTILLHCESTFKMAACHYVNNCTHKWHKFYITCAIILPVAHAIIQIPAGSQVQIPAWSWISVDMFFSIAFITCLPWNIQPHWFLPCEILCNINLGLWVILINPLVVHSNLQAIWIGTRILFLLFFPLLYSLTTLLFIHHSTLLLFPLSSLYHEIWNFHDTWKFYHIILPLQSFFILS